MVFSARLHSVEDKETILSHSSLSEEERGDDEPQSKSSPDIPRAELEDIYHLYSKKVQRLAQRAQGGDLPLSGKREALHNLAVNAAKHHGANPKRLAHVLEVGCVKGAMIGVSVVTGGVGEVVTAFPHHQNGSGERLSTLLQIAESETLFHAGLSSGLSGESLVRLTSFRSSSLGKILPMSRDEKHLQELVQVATRSGYEEAVFGKSLTPSSLQLLRYAGIYGASLTSYISAVVAVVEGVGGAELRSWLPGGKEFQEIERQRLRWGQAPFQYDAYSEVAPEVFGAVAMYYQEQRGLSDSEAVGCATDFLQGVFPDSVSIA
jgi:hypothetical protein